MRGLLMPYTRKVAVAVCVKWKIFMWFHDKWLVSCALQVIDDAFDCFFVQSLRFFREPCALVNGK
jgi:hypothetical protein